MTDSQSKVDLEHITVKFRWILPIMFAGYVIAWGINENWKNQRFDKLESSQEKTWTVIGDYQKRLNCITQNMAHCCRDASIC